jgi:hypothetical protein
MHPPSAEIAAGPAGVVVAGPTHCIGREREPRCRPFGGAQQGLGVEASQRRLPSPASPARITLSRRPSCSQPLTAARARACPRTSLNRRGRTRSAKGRDTTELTSPSRRKHGFDSRRTRQGF